MITLRSHLAGEWREGGGGPSTTLYDPTTEEPIAESSTHGLDLAGALAYARSVGGPTLRNLTFAERGALLRRMSKALQDAREALLDVSTRNGGATRSDGKFDVDGGIATLAYYAQLGERLGDRRYLVEGPGEPLGRSPRFAGYHLRVPRTGVAVHVNAYNFPVWGLCEKAAVALLAGVPSVAKPATSTAWIAVRAMEALVSEAAIPEGALQLLAGGIGDLLDHLLPEDSIAFTGSAETGARLRQIPAVVAKSVRINVEADSLNSSVLGSDVEPGSDTWNLFVRHVILEMTQKAGQKCTATRRLFVPAHRIDEIEAELDEGLSRVRVGDPGESGIDMGPLVTRQQLADARRGIAALLADGARSIRGGEPLARKGYFLPPTLLRHDSPHEAKAVHEVEVFGPLTTLMPYTETSDAVALVCRGQGSLVASLYANDRDFLEQMILGCAPWSGRLAIASAKITDSMTPPGTVLAACVHGGPGRAGGGEELGGERGLAFYTQRTAIQGDRGLLDRILGAPRS
jgi:3,4-dehydroadipyl-CoA semialdehyde dehydrogenase